MSTMMQSFNALCTNLVQELRNIDTELQRDSRTSAEDQLKTPIHNFLTAYGEMHKTQVRVFTEHRQGKDDQVQGVRLDMAVKNQRGQLVGHVELKAPAKSANPYRQSGWSAHDKTQWKRLANHSNLIYTNGWEWTLLRHGVDRPIFHIILNPDKSGILSGEQLSTLERLLTQFFSWKPVTPSSPKGLADTLAPLTRFLRDTVVEVVTDDNPDALDKLYKSWAADLMPGATVKQFADSFAQTFTYALLLARVESDVPPEEFNANAISSNLRSNGHRLIGAVLELMAQPQTRALVEGPVVLLEATIGSVSVDKFTQNVDPWLYFYEDFLASYDPKMRADAGVYYTPVEIVETQVRLLDEVLKTRFGRPDGLGDDATNILDNATGTATYPLAVARHVLRNAPSPQDAARSLAKRLYAFELLVGPYSVGHMRLTQMLESTGIDLGKDGVQVYLTNALTDPGDVSDDYEQMSLWEVMEDINEENRKAGLVKNSRTPIRVILGNPPYDRGSKGKTLGAGSTRYKNVILEEVHGRRPLLQDFIDPLRASGQGAQAKNLYNSYVYFIRWAIWKACEQRKNETGVVSYITSSSYLRGPGFAGLREYMRKVFDEIWIIDLGGEGRGARKEENVFAIQTPVAIFIGIQHPATSNGTLKQHADRIRQKAAVYYRRVTGTKAEKLSALKTIQAPSPQHYKDWDRLASGGWSDKFIPSTSAALSDGIPLGNIFPLSSSGVQFKRKWPIGPTHDTLMARWRELESANAESELANLFKESRDKKIQKSGIDLVTLESLPGISADMRRRDPVRYGYRSFDRQFAFPDSRVIDTPHQQLWDSYGPHQFYLVSLTSTPLGIGPAVTISPYVPDMDFFKNRGAKDVHPLYRTDDTQEPNISMSLVQALEQVYGEKPLPFDIAAYVVGLLGTTAYTKHFEEELAESVAHVPFTADPKLFQEVAEFGRAIIFEETWGERGAELNEFGQPTGQRFRGTAIMGIPIPESDYPEKWTYDAETQQLFVGKGRFDCVKSEVMDFEVSGMKVVASWLGYRMKKPAGKSSSPLDQIQALVWQHDTELLELLWQIEFMINAEPEGHRLLQAVLQGEKIAPEILGVPTAAERKAPPKKKLGTML